MTKIFNQKWSLERRRDLRNGMTKPEVLLWLALKADQLGVRFRRQYGIGRYITDFYSPQLRLVIELDGAQHYTPEGKQYDAIRTGSFESIGIQVIRFTNDEIHENLHVVLQRLRAAIAVRQSCRPSTA